MRIIYFGIFDPDFSRNKVFRDALALSGVDVEIMSERGKGAGKYWRLARRLMRAAPYDAVIVGYPGYTSVPFARLFSRRPVIFDALCTYYEGQVLSRNAYKGNPLGLLWCRFIDRLSVMLSDIVLVETEAQRRHFLDRFGLAEGKVATLYTGVDESSFGSTVPTAKTGPFTVVFRGRITDEAGVEHVIEAAKLLEGTGIDFKIIGFGWGEPVERARQAIARYKPTNLAWIERKLPVEELVRELSSASLSLGQFGDNDRLARTIPHKAFESMLLRIPYVTAEAEGIKEAFTDKTTGFFVPACDARALSQKIRFLREHYKEALETANAAHAVYEQRFSRAALGATLYSILRSAL
jgi:glycosyltransferase involved in cell wall biosynthesis